MKKRVKNITSPTFRHRAIMGLFGQIGGSTPRQELGILFRLETPATEAPYFLVQSLQYPDRETLKKISGAQCKDIELQVPPTGTPVLFRVAVNAVKRTSITDASNKRRTLIKPVELDGIGSPDSTISPWIANKLSPALNEVSVLNHRREVLTDPRDKKKPQSMTVQIDTIDGVATVADPSTLEEILTHGIGREKAYGCGLLTVRVAG